MMKKYNYFSALCFAAAMAFTACTQDELADGGDTLPEGKYPLQIASVTMEGESSAQPWGAKEAQTRVSENEDGTGSVWDGKEKIGVQITNDTETAIYTLETDKVTLTSDKPLYWKNKNASTVRAWYPANGNVDLSNQTKDNGLAYALFAETANEVDYNTSNITLPFVHKLAKIRVVLQGTGKDNVKEVKIKTLTSCTLKTDGTLTNDGTEEYIPMVQTTYNNETCWEANVVSGYTITEFQVNGKGGELDNDITPLAAMVNTITLTVNKAATEITGGETITTPGDYIVTGNVNETITLSSEGINLTLKDANISVSSGNGINITSGSPTIRVEGTNNTVKSSNDAGIYVAAGSTVNITGNSRSDKLTVTAGGDAAGIGGCSNKQDCGNINISKVTVIAKGSDSVAFSPGIGSTSTAQCGAITIDDATVHAYGTGVPNTCACPGIGTGGDNSGSTGTVLPAITIRNNSEVHAHRGNEYADYIGYAYWQTSGGQVRGTITGSTVYCYTGDSDTSDKTIVYDASGTATVQ